MSGIYYCPERNMLIPASAFPAAVLLNNNVAAPCDYGYEYYYPPTAIHHQALQQHQQPTTAAMHNGMMLPAEFDYNSLVAQMNNNRGYSSAGGFGRGAAAVSQMPEWLLDEEGNFTVSLQDIVELDLFFVCVRDKKGSQYIQDNFPTEDSPLKKKLYDMLFESQSIYNLAMDMFGNFVIQKMITEAGEEYGEKMLSLLSSQAADMAFNRFSCRVIQKAIDTFPAKMLEPMLNSFSGYVLAMSTEQSANHVLQKIIESVPAKDFGFIVDEMCMAANMDRIIRNKFGCRVIQFCLEKLTKSYEGDLMKDDCMEAHLIRTLLDKITRKAFRYSQDEFANYIIQYIVKQQPSLSVYRDRVIQHSLLGNIVTLSQSKYSSHVIEQAFQCAPDNLLQEMIKEVFTGKVNPKNNRDSLDQMLFDQFGNYVIQRLLQISIQVRHGQRQGNLKWFEVLSQRICHNAEALQKYSSGKKIIETVSKELGYAIV